MQCNAMQCNAIQYSTLPTVRYTTCTYLTFNQVQCGTICILIRYNTNYFNTLMTQYLLHVYQFHFSTLQYNTLHCVVLHDISWHYMTVQYDTVWLTWHYSRYNCIISKGKSVYPRTHITLIITIAEQPHCLLTSVLVLLSWQET